MRWMTQTTYPPLGKRSRQQVVQILHVLLQVTFAFTIGALETQPAINLAHISSSQHLN